MPLEIDTGVEHGGDEGVSQHVGVHARELQAGCIGETSQASRCAVTVHPGTATCQQDRSVLACVDCSLDGSAHGRWQGDEHDLAALSAHSQHAVPVLLAQVVDVASGGLEDPQPEETEHGDQRETFGLGESLAAVRSASNCRWVRPSVGDSAGTLGLRTYSAGECASAPSITQVR